MKLYQDDINKRFYFRIKTMSVILRDLYIPIGKMLFEASPASHFWLSFVLLFFVNGRYRLDGADVKNFCDKYFFKVYGRIVNCFKA